MDDSVELESIRSNNNRKETDVAVETFDKDDIVYPDGGFEAYTVIAGSFLGAITCLGLINSIGAIQAYVSTHQLKYLNASSISWIFSIYLSLAYALGVIVGPIFDRKGPKIILACATSLVFAGLMGSANSKEVYQFILSFVALGIGNGIGLTPLVGVINHWFLRKRGVVTGLVTSGGSVGGLVFPLLLRHTFEKYGFAWSMRILAFINGACMLASVFLVKSRIQRTVVKSDNPVFKKGIDGGFNIDLDLAVKKTMKFLKKNSDKTFLLTIAGSFCTELCLVLTLTYFVTYAMAQGVSESVGYLLLTTWNATSIAGRILPGLCSDYLGKFNVNLFMISVLSLCMFAIWYACGSQLHALYVFAALGGFFLGLILGMIPACLAQISKVSEFGERYGVLNFFLSFGNLVGVPIGAAIINDGSTKNYDLFVILVGCLCVAGVLFFLLSRYTIVGLRLNVKV